MFFRRRQPGKIRSPKRPSGTAPRESTCVACPSRRSGNERKVRAERPKPKPGVVHLDGTIAGPLIEQHPPAKEIHIAGVRPMAQRSLPQCASEQRSVPMQQWNPGVMLDREPTIGHRDENGARDADQLAQKTHALLATADVFENRVRPSDVE